MNPKFLAKLIFIAFFGRYFSKICQKFSKTAPSVSILDPSGPKMGKTTPPPDEMMGKQWTCIIREDLRIGLQAGFCDENCLSDLGGKKLSGRFEPSMNLPT